MIPMAYARAARVAIAIIGKIIHEGNSGTEGEGDDVRDGESEDVAVGLGAGSWVVVEFFAFTHIPGGKLMNIPYAPAESHTLTSIR